MHHDRLGEDPRWALYRHREQLHLTDPPAVGTGRPRSRHRRRALLAAAALIALRADTGPASAHTEAEIPHHELLTGQAGDNTIEGKADEPPT